MDACRHLLGFDWRHARKFLGLFLRCIFAVGLGNGMALGGCLPALARICMETKFLGLCYEESSPVALGVLPWVQHMKRPPPGSQNTSILRWCYLEFLVGWVVAGGLGE